jgi:hypothetical protein
VEANKRWVLTKLEKMGLGHFLLVRTKDNIIMPWAEVSEEERKAVSSTTEVIEEYCRKINTYLKRPNQLDTTIDYCMAMKNRRLVKNLMRFSPLNTKEFDDVVGFGYLLMARDAMFSLFDKIKKRAEQDRGIEAAFAAFSQAV